MDSAKWKRYINWRSKMSSDSDFGLSSILSPTLATTNALGITGSNSVFNNPFNAGDNSFIKKPFGNLFSGPDYSSLTEAQKALLAQQLATNATTATQADVKASTTAQNLIKEQAFLLPDSSLTSSYMG